MPTTKSDLAHLTLLGRKARPGKKLEAFPNHNPERRYTVTLTCDEFTCLCPATGAPDFASITIRYIPNRWILRIEIPEIVSVVVPQRGGFPRACGQYDLRRRGQGGGSALDRSNRRVRRPGGNPDHGCGDA